MEREKSCGCIIINDENKVLLVHQVSGHWGIPKGHVEEGETEEQTAIREVKEETNIDVEINSNYRYSIEYSPKENVMKEVVFFIAKNTTNDILSQESEVAESKWFTFDEAIDTVTFDNTKEILRKAKIDIENK